jgi:hypothetical protein
MMTFVVMQKLALQKQDSLTTLALQCQSLQEVDLSECESLTNSICDVFSDGGGCPMLKSLVLDNCEVHEQIIFFGFSWIHFPKYTSYVSSIFLQIKWLFSYF